MEAELKFERENRKGVAVVGSYLIDAAGRLGVEIHCERLGLTDSCAVKVTKGSENLSELTKAETELLSAERRKNGERLACQTKINKAGEISIMTHEQKEPEVAPEEKMAEDYKKSFAELPLEKKIAQLVDLEAIAFGETFAYILNSPYTIGGKIVDVLAEFGFKFDKEAKDATRPDEHKPKEEKSAEKTEEKAESKETSTKKTPPKRTKKTTQGNTKKTDSQ